MPAGPAEAKYAVPTNLPPTRLYLSFVSFVSELDDLESSNVLEHGSWLSSTLSIVLARDRLQPLSKINGIPVSGLSLDAARERVARV